MSGDDGPTRLERGFRLLGDETRVAILRAVWAADGEAVAFSDLRGAVGSPDSGRFNYHLGELEGRFLVAGDDGYRLTAAGREVVRALLAGALEEHPTLAEASIDATCGDCGGTLVAGYDQQATVACPDCGTTVLRNEFPPAGLVGRDHDAVARALDRWVTHRFRLAADGVCPNCASPTSVDLPDPEDPHPATVHRCTNCGYRARIPLYAHAVAHPAVVGLYERVGVDVTALPFWDLRHRRPDWTVAVTEDPWRASVTVAPGTDSVTVAFDGTLEATVIDRSES